MSALACDRCDKSLLVDEDVRYEVTIRVTAAYDPLELHLDRLQAGEGQEEREDEIARLLRAVEGKSAEELEAEVWKELRFDLCLACQREFLRDPLPRVRRAAGALLDPT